METRLLNKLGHREYSGHMTSTASIFEWICFHNISIRINAPVWLDEETPPPHPSRHLLSPLPVAAVSWGQGRTDRKTNICTHTHTYGHFRFPNSPQNAYFWTLGGNTRTWREPRRRKLRFHHSFFLFLFFCAKKANISKISTKDHCNLQVHPLNGVKRMQRSFCAILGVQHNERANMQTPCRKTPGLGIKPTTCLL